ncbi:MAG: DEAD/DEAH box helicase family protein, partial [Methylococcales bacterium]|nr:DEAD/DEAH box helicase family protein [Methylococcales bacterium]
TGKPIVSTPHWLYAQSQSKDFKDQINFLSKNELAEQQAIELKKIQDREAKEQARAAEIKANNKAQREKNKADKELLKEKEPTAEPEIERTSRNYSITSELGQGSAKEKARDNIDAIKIIQAIDNGKKVTRDDQNKLVKYSGWGSTELAQGMFPPNQYRIKEGWSDLSSELKETLSESDWHEARKSTLYAHYTPKPVIENMYKALDQFGFEGGKILDPGAGTGHFQGMMPNEMSKKSQYTGFELDPTSAKIAQALYPDSNFKEADFTKTQLPKDYFDLAIGNPPYDQLTIKTDPEYRAERFKIHDYFAAKSIDRVRPGGIMAVVISKGTMDKKSTQARDYIADRADLIAAIRLPETTFKKNAGTQTVTDILFLQKREVGQEAAGEKWRDVVDINSDESPVKYGNFKFPGNVKVNEYFKNHPEHVIGNFEMDSGRFGPELTVKFDGNLDQKLSEVISKLPKNIYTKSTDKTPDLSFNNDDELQRTADKISFSENRKPGAYFIKDDELYAVNEQGQGEAIQLKKGKGEGLYQKQINIIKDIVPVKEALHDVFAANLDDSLDLEKAQSQLDKSYDSFVKTHGAINKHTVTKAGRKRNPNLDAILADPDAYRLASIENYDEQTSEAKKGTVFTQKVLNIQSQPSIDTAADAMAYTLNRDGKLNIKNISEAAKLTEKETLQELGELIYKNPQSEQWQTADKYLSGNVRKKLDEAKAIADIDKSYARNVEALAKVQPKDLRHDEISLRLGAPWIPKEMISQFSKDVLQTPLKISHTPEVSHYALDDTYQRSEKKAGAYSTSRKSTKEILDAVLNSKSLKVFDSVNIGDGKTKAVINPKATEAAQEKARKMRASFEKWAYRDPVRRETLVKKYNYEYNNIQVRKYDGSHLTFPGMSSAYQLRQHQKDAAWRTIQEGNAYIAHAVGAGKTLESIAAAQEMKRLGLAKKNMFVVPNHMLKQFSKEYLEAYPAADILVADEVQFDKKRREQFLGKVKSKDWDAVIITHSGFGKIPVSPEFEGKLLHKEVKQFENLLIETKGDSLTTKMLARQLERVYQKQHKLTERTAKQDRQGLHFEDLGIDNVVVDEAQEFRKVSFATNQSDIKGIDPNGSARAWDLYVKTQHLQEKNNGRGLQLLSGTPVTNTMGEMYTIQKFLQPKALKEKQIQNFDSWAAMFGDTVSNLEMTPSGDYKPVTRFAKFQNLPELTQMFREVADVVTSSDLGSVVQRPDVNGGKMRIIAAPKTQSLSNYQSTLGDRLEAIENRDRPPQKGDDIVPSVITDGRFAAVDMRFVDPKLPADPNSKLSLLIDEVHKTWIKTRNDEYVDKEGKTEPVKGSAQMVFSDIGTPASMKTRGFSAYSAIKKELIDRGIPAKEIAFMQDHKKSEEKLDLFSKINSGEVSILIGSSITMGTGVNAQKRLSALHHLDAPWIPADVEQRNGRIIRQGNQNKNVDVVAYATTGSTDSTMWQLLETKQKFIDQAMAGDTSIRTMDDLNSNADQFAMAKAISSGNPEVLKMAGLEQDIKRLERLKGAHTDEQRQVVTQLKSHEKSIDSFTKKLSSMDEDMSNRKDTKGDNFEATINGKKYDKRAEAGKALIEQVKSVKAGEHKDVGTLGGFKIEVDSGFLEPEITLSGKRDLVSFDVSDTTSEKAIWRRLEGAITGLDKEYKQVKDDIDYHQRSINQLKPQAETKSTFEYESELTDKKRELTGIQKSVISEQEDKKTTEKDHESKLLHAVKTLKPKDAVIKHPELNSLYPVLSLAKKQAREQNLDPDKSQKMLVSVMEKSVNQLSRGKPLPNVQAQLQADIGR